MRTASISISLVLALFTYDGHGFVIQRRGLVPALTPKSSLHDCRRTSTRFFMSSGDEDETASLETPGKTSTRQRRRVRRKDASAIESVTESTSSSESGKDEEAMDTTTLESSKQESEPKAPEPILQQRQDSPVELKVQDVRDLVEGFTSQSSGSDKKKTRSTAAKGVAQTQSKSPFPSPSTSADDSLEMLLEDARRMRAEENEVSSDEENSGNLKAKVRDILSTIVTADFFVVCGFLVWFLAGIFASTVLNDDTVQIAFNSNFQALVQPALGVLMIGALASNFLSDEEEEDLN